MFCFCQGCFKLSALDLWACHCIFSWNAEKRKLTLRNFFSLQLLWCHQATVRFVILCQARAHLWDQPNVMKKETKLQGTPQEGKDRKRKQEMAGWRPAPLQNWQQSSAAALSRRTGSWKEHQSAGMEEEEHQSYTNMMASWRTGTCTTV